LSWLVLATLIGVLTLSEPTWAQKDKDKKGASASLSFVIDLDKQGKYRFKLVDNDGTTLAIGVRGYDTKADCQAHIDAIRKLAAKADADDQSKGTDKKKMKD
jgi:uncharacterized protein YegP (UPF0339 family)